MNTIKSAADDKINDKNYNLLETLSSTPLYLRIETHYRDEMQVSRWLRDLDTDGAHAVIEIKSIRIMSPEDADAVRAKERAEAAMEAAKHNLANAQRVIAQLEQELIDMESSDNG